MGCDGGNVRVVGDGERHTFEARPARLDDDVGSRALASCPIDGETTLGILVASAKGKGRKRRGREGLNRPSHGSRDPIRGIWEGG
jgi:hypothetical protein